MKIYSTIRSFYKDINITLESVYFLVPKSEEPQQTSGWDLKMEFAG